MSGLSDEFAAFVRSHSRSLYGTAFMLTGSAHEAEELVQDTLAALFPKWSTVALADFPVAYVRRALINRFVSGRRRALAHPQASWNVDEHAAGPDVAEAATDRRLLIGLLAELPERQRAALVMRYVHDAPDAEIAAALGCRTATVRSLASRGLALMRARLTQNQAISSGAGREGGAA
ncbi:MAG TPA: SigE family RNA polymerase sigma factor [Jatrophihabitantaceae bacterium]|jgi:RNA polymerase sigma-70 factor (sigma-E family)|nr:SigE family RNA polymerase sigma factor [Jatrophihabitantaceae bacterium]